MGRSFRGFLTVWIPLIYRFKLQKLKLLAVGSTAPKYKGDGVGILLMPGFEYVSLVVLDRSLKKFGGPRWCKNRSGCPPCVFVGIFLGARLVPGPVALRAVRSAYSVTSWGHHFKCF